MLFVTRQKWQRPTTIITRHPNTTRIASSTNGEARKRPGRETGTAPPPKNKATNQSQHPFFSTCAAFEAAARHGAELPSARLKGGGPNIPRTVPIRASKMRLYHFLGGGSEGEGTELSYEEMIERQEARKARRGTVSNAYGSGTQTSALAYQFSLSCLVLILTLSSLIVVSPFLHSSFFILCSISAGGDSVERAAAVSDHAGCAVHRARGTRKGRIVHSRSQGKRR